MTARQFEYLVAQVQEGRVTFVNGKWVGKVPMEEVVRKGGHDASSCELIWDWLQDQGRQGWELVSVTTEAVPGTILTQVYMKRTSG
ncbi:hypothetical protein ACLESO_11115 [Pyxidicoccus sp. 3LG]